jgi:acrylyl-CoA reductase (NADPH)
MTPKPPASLRAFVVRETADGRSARFETLAPSDLPDGELLVQVRYSSLNYKDGLAVTGKGKVIRKFPMVPGIDLAGTVLESRSAAFAPGSEVLVTGYGLGEASFGGYAELARVRSDWALPVPPPLGARRAMAVGTAGLTAALCVEAILAAGVRPGGREAIVTGAAGGVGSVAVALLARAGFAVAASTGRPGERAFLERLGAKRIVPREELARPAAKPLEAETWACGVDAVGGAVLGTVLRQTAYGGAVAACGPLGGAPRRPHDRDPARRRARLGRADPGRRGPRASGGGRVSLAPVAASRRAVLLPARAAGGDIIFRTQPWPRP